MIRIEEPSSRSMSCNGCGGHDQNWGINIMRNVHGHLHGHETILCKECRESLIFLLGGTTPEMIRENCEEEEDE